MMFTALANHQSRILSLNSFREAIGLTRETVKTVAANTSDEPLSDESSLFIPEQMPTLAEASRYLVNEAMRRADGNQSIACGMLGITRQALGQRLKKMELDSSSDE